MKYKKIHFIGICGAGMSAVAKLCKDMGIEVSGSDAGFYPPISDYIKDHNISFTEGYSQDNISRDIDLIVIGKHAALIPEENDEVKKAFELEAEGKVKITSFAKLLQEITVGKENIVCAGSYGKSTTTTLMAHILLEIYGDIGYFIGAAPITPNINAHLGKEKYFILEGDEYPSSNFDNSSKFIYYNAHDVLLTSLSHDHVNIYKTHNEYKKVFLDLITQIADKSKNSKIKDAKYSLIICAEDKSIQEEYESIEEIVSIGNINLITYGVDTGNYFARNIRYGDISSFDLYKTSDMGEEFILNISTSLLGKHNIQNIIGVCAMIFEKGILDIKDEAAKMKLQNAIISFKGLKRRLDLLNEGKQIRVYEGFGSSYEKARAAIDAILLHFPEKNLNIIFEPHTFSWRNKDAIIWYDTVFAEAERVFVYQPPLHGASTHTQLTQDDIVNRIEENKQRSDQEVYKLNIGGELDSKFIKSKLENNKDIVLILSSGDLGGVIKILPEILS